MNKTKQPLPMPETAFDPINPLHYRSRDDSNIACSDAQRSMLSREGYQAYLAGMVVKYTWRYHEKNGTQDLEKAAQCLGMLIDEIRRE